MPMQPRGQPNHIVVLGEVLLDLFVPRPGLTLVDAETLVPHLGGAPANVAVQLARLGVPVSLWTAVADDAFGLRVLTQLSDEGVDVSGVQTLSGRHTGLTFVEVDDDGERRFLPRRENAADQALTAASLPLSSLTSTTIFHHGTVSLRAPSVRAATRAAVRAARRAGAWVSLDVNLRFGMFPSREGLLRLAQKAMGHAHILKATGEEARLLVGGDDDDDVITRLLDAGPSLILLTKDVDGAVVATRKHAVRVSSPAVTAVDATGAGDAFMGAALAALVDAGARGSSHRFDVADLDEPALKTIGDAGCLAGAKAVTALGATTGMMRTTRLVQRN